ncbi:hypothetical protein B0H17DRAFT_1137865, partial [Mycena rosella]
DTDILVTAAKSIYLGIEADLSELTEESELNRFGRFGAVGFYCTNFISPIHTDKDTVKVDQPTLHPCIQLSKENCGLTTTTLRWVFDGRDEHGTMWKEPRLAGTFAMAITFVGVYDFNPSPMTLSVNAFTAAFGCRLQRGSAQCFRSHVNGVSSSSSAPKNRPTTRARQHLQWRRVLSWFSPHLRMTRRTRCTQGPRASVSLGPAGNQLQGPVTALCSCFFHLFSLSISHVSQYPGHFCIIISPTAKGDPIMRNRTSQGPLLYAADPEGSLKPCSRKPKERICNWLSRPTLVPRQVHAEFAPAAHSANAWPWSDPSTRLRAGAGGVRPRLRMRLRDFRQAGGHGCGLTPLLVPRWDLGAHTGMFPGWSASFTSITMLRDTLFSAEDPVQHFLACS